LAVEQVLAVDLWKFCVGSSPTIVIFLYVAPALAQLLAVAFAIIHVPNLTVVKFL